MFHPPRLALSVDEKRWERRVQNFKDCFFPLERNSYLILLFFFEMGFLDDFLKSEFC